MSLLDHDGVRRNKTVELTLASDAILDIRRHIYHGSEGCATVNTDTSQRVADLPVLRVLAGDEHFLVVDVVFEILVSCNTVDARNVELGSLLERHLHVLSNKSGGWGSCPFQESPAPAPALMLSLSWVILSWPRWQWEGQWTSLKSVISSTFVNP